MFERDTVGIAADRLLFGHGSLAQPLSWRAAGMLNQVTESDGTSAIWIQREVLEPFHELLKTDEGQADLSSDGRWIAFVLRSHDTARFEVFIASADDPTLRRQLSNGGGAQPTWRADGHELYYIDSAHRVVAVDFHDGQVGATTPLFAIPIENVFYANRDFAPARDGQRFVVNLPLKQVRRASATVVVQVQVAE